MAWQTADYQYGINGLDPFDYCTAFVVVSEGMAGRESADFKFPGLHGEQEYPFKLFDGRNVILSTVLRYTNASDTITHPNGAAGHVYENLAALKAVFGRTDQLTRLTRRDPGTTTVGGDEYFMDLSQIEPVEAESDVEHHFIWPARALSPFWASSTLQGPTALTTGNFNPGGNAPVDDAIYTFTGDGSVQNNLNGDRIEISGSGGATVVVNCGYPRSIKQGATNRDSWFQTFSERWMHMEGGVNNALVVSGSVTIQYRIKRH